MQKWISMLVVLTFAGCAGDSTSRTCTGELYDACFDEHNCTSGNCHNFSTEGFQACSTSCTPGDDTPCMTTADGRKATCSAAGICTPPAANDCTPTI